MAMEMGERQRGATAGGGKEIVESGIRCRIVRSSRKTLALQIDAAGNVTARAPLRMKEEQIRAFIREKELWIRQRCELARQRAEEKALLPDLNAGEREQCIRRAREVFAARTAFFAEKLGVTYGKITIRDQKTRWGSCSRAGNLNFNFRLVMAPAEILDYVVVHELCHRKQMNHSALFWAEVGRLIPDYQERRMWLKQNGWKLMGKSECG